ncbi:MAG TPA: MFS transporter [Gaiellaceae bacterium]|nr:MFS transporter [Gaiellaceae bacterium]
MRSEFAIGEGAVWRTLARVERGAGIGTRATVGGLGVGFTVGWNITALGAIATRLSHAYGVGLATVGLFTTAQFVVHMSMQIPGGRIADRFGARRTALAGLGVIAAGNALSLIAQQPVYAFFGRAVVGLGTGLAFVSGSDYVRSRGGSAFLQGVYGSASVLAPGIALALVPGFANWTGFRAPYLSAVVVAAISTVALALAPPGPRTARHRGERLDSGLMRDTKLYRFAAIHALSFGFSVVVGNWVETLLEHHGHSKAVAAAAGSLTLLLGFFTRIWGGSLLRRPDASRWVAVSLVLGGAGAVALAAPLPAAGLFAAAAVVGLAAGVPFAMAFSGAAAARPEAPGAAVGYINAWAALVIVAGTPLVGLTFSLPGDGRIGFVAAGVLAALAAFATPR